MDDYCAARSGLIPPLQWPTFSPPFSEIEEVFRNFGFQIYFPEDHPIEDQIRTFSSAECVAGEEGSGLHNSMFASAGAKIISLRNEFNHSLIQLSLDQAHSQESVVIFGTAQDHIAKTRASPFLVEKELVRNYLRNI